MTRMDSPIEWTNEAHLVGVSCVECREPLTVPEGRAEQGGVTCPDCEHTCLGHLEHYESLEADLEATGKLPEDTLVYRCSAAHCGKVLLFDIRSGDHYPPEFDY